MSLDILNTIDPVSTQSRIKELQALLEQQSLKGDYQGAGTTQAELTQEQSKLDLFEEVSGLVKQKDEATLLLIDPEFSDLASSEIESLDTQIERKLAMLQRLILPRLEFDERNALMEIRAGTGGTEAALFAEEVMRMYLRYATLSGFKVETLSTSFNEEGGLKETIFAIYGPQPYGHFRFEAGVHRVQRVPVTESSGRIHTSAISVAVLPEIPVTDVAIDPSEIKIDVYRSSGPGGQSVNTTDSAVRITHLPTGIIVTCQDGKSQHKNKEKALSVLASKLKAIEHEKHALATGDLRKQAVQSGDRSAKIRTFNFQQGRVTDHRVNISWFNLGEIMEGQIEEIVSTVNTQLRLELHS